MTPTLGVRWERQIRKDRENTWGENNKIDKDSDNKRKTGILTASYERACVYVSVCARVHVPVGAGWATPPCLMSLWRQSHVCRPLMQTGWSKYLFNFGSPLRENGALHKHRLQSSFAHSWPSYSQRWDHRAGSQDRSARAQHRRDWKVGTCWERLVSNQETCCSTTRMHIPFPNRFTDEGVILVTQRSKTCNQLASHLPPLSISPCFLSLSAVNYPTKAKCHKKCHKQLWPQMNGWPNITLS